MTKPKYSNIPFDGYTHRFEVSFFYKKNGEEKITEKKLNVYSDDGSKEELITRLFENEEKRNKILSASFSYFNVNKIYTKREDDETAEFITGFLNKI